MSEENCHLECEYSTEEEKFAVNADACKIECEFYPGGEDHGDEDEHHEGEDDGDVPDDDENDM